MSLWCSSSTGFLSERTCWRSLCFASSPLLGIHAWACFLPQTSALPFLLAFKHMGEAHMGVQSDHWGRPECVCVSVSVSWVCVCVCVHERIMPFSIRGVSRERKGKMLTELRCDKWFFSTTLNLKARSSSSFYSPNHVRAFRLRLKNPVYTLFFRPLCVFVARPFFRPFFFARDYRKALKTPLAKSTSVVSPHKRKKERLSV